ncbi:MAG TPA: NHL repeat-containing protein [Kineosporiaceae bacterium]
MSIETRVSTGVTYRRGDDDPAHRHGWTPLRVLGASSGFSLALPDATPTRGHLYAPRGVLLDPAREATRVIAADTGNHRLLVWPDVPAGDGADCATVVGQPGPRTEGPQAGGRGPERGLHLPTGLARTGELVLVADGWNHRIVGYPAALDVDDPEPVWWLGQPDLASVTENAGGEVDAASLYWPFGVLWHDGWLWVADTGNRRVLGWHGLPEGPRVPADVVLGQPSPHARDENRGGDVGPRSFRWPHQLAVLPDRDGEVLWVADAGNHRLLGWRLPVTTDRPADAVLGQEGFTTAGELPHVPQGPARLRFPYAVTASAGDLLVADTANNRVLGWTARAAVAAPGAAADTVLGQYGFDPVGENRWSAVTADSLCWPYGLAAARDARFGDVLAIADSGNNRVVLWHRPEAAR